MRTSAVVTLCSLAYLLGLLITDFFFDALSDYTQARVYYCSLARHLLTPLGILRMFPACFVLGWSSLKSMYSSNRGTKRQHVYAGLSICIFGIPGVVTSFSLVYWFCSAWHHEWNGLLLAIAHGFILFGFLAGAYFTLAAELGDKLKI